MIIRDGNPLENYEYYKKMMLSNEERDLVDKLLVIMYFIEKTVMTISKIKYYIYIQEDQSLKWAYNYVCSRKWEDAILNKAILVLDLSKMIYRFPCAQKFDVEMSYENQLRINSWGRKYVEENVICKQKEWIEQAERQINEYIYNNKKKYIELTKLLKPQSEGYNNNKIKQINSSIKIRLLS